MRPERRQEEATPWICQACWLCQAVMHCRTLGERGEDRPSLHFTRRHD